jgi:NAD+-processing family protein with receiver domain
MTAFGSRGKMNIWLDDMRKPPTGWAWAKNYDEFVTLIEDGPVDLISLDFDLGIYSGEQLDGDHALAYVQENDLWPRLGIGVHSANPVGANAMVHTIERYGPYVEVDNVDFDNGWDGIMYHNGNI